MSDAPEDPTSESQGAGLKRAGFNLGAFVLGFGFVLIVFENFALALLFALICGGGSYAAQRAAKRS